MSTVKGVSELLLVILDTSGKVFGGYIPTELAFKETFFGSGEAFLFKLDQDQSSVVVFGSTLENLHFVYCDSDGFGFGSDPYYGLFIDPELTKGSTHACKTYANDLLTVVNHFTIKRIELWSVRKQ